MNSESIHVLWVIPGQYSCFVYMLTGTLSTHCLHPHWNFEYTKAVTLYCAEVGGGKDQGPTTQVTHLRFQFLQCDRHILLKVTSSDRRLEDDNLNCAALQFLTVFLVH